MYYYIQSFICTHILQGFHFGANCHGSGGLMVHVGAGHPPC